MLIFVVNVNDHLRSEGAIVCLSGCLLVRMSQPLELSSENFQGINAHHPMVKRVYKFENGYIGVRGW